MPKYGLIRNNNKNKTNSDVTTTEHNEIIINGQKRKLSKSSQYYLDMLTIEEGK